MKFLTDENIASSVVRELRNKKHDVKDIKEEQLQGILDKEILELANKESRTIITHDKDFAQVSSKIKHCGIILVSLKHQHPEAVSIALSRTLESKLTKKIENKLIIITESRIRIQKTF